MALTSKQLWNVGKIDTKVQKLVRSGKDDMAIFAAMADDMPSFKAVLDAARPDDIDQLAGKFPGFYRYAKILEALAAGIRSGATPVSARKPAPRQTEPTTAHRSHAAAIDLRMRQLAEEGVPRSAIIDRMAAYVVDLGTIWNATTDEQLAALCDEYPGFHAYAVLMEEAAEADRRKPTRPQDDLPELPQAVKEQLSSLLSTAAKLQRDYQSALDTGSAAARASRLLPVSRLHTEWDADRTRFTATLQRDGVPQKTRDFIRHAFARIDQEIDVLKARLQAI